jgi:uncharacterized membrane protein YfcA
LIEHLLFIISKLTALKEQCYLLIEIIIILIIVGLGAGTLGSMIGVGGGIIMTPVLAFMGLMPSHIASTSLIAVTSASVSSTIAYSKQKRIDYGVGLKMASLSIPGAIIGAFLSSGISIGSFKVYFAILLMLTGTYIAYRNSILKEKPDTKSKSMSFHLLFYTGSFAAGIISSLFGVGGGIVFVPMMIIILGITMLRAGPTSQLTLLITSLAGVFTHAVLGHSDYIYAVSLSSGAFVGGQIGARLSRCIKESILQKILSISLIAVAVKLIFDFIYKQ